MNKRRYAMTARAEQAAATGDRVLDAMLRAYAITPYDLLRLDDVAADAGVTVQTVLRRFGSKAGLLVALVVRESGRIAAGRASAAGSDVGDVLHALVAHYETYGDLIATMYADAVRVEGLAPVARTARESHVAWCVAVFADALADLDEAGRRRRTAQVVALLDATTWRILRREQGLSTQEVETALAELLAPLVR
jgi:AcrR family transcriptional regulator